MDIPTWSRQSFKGNVVLTSLHGGVHDITLTEFL